MNILPETDYYRIRSKLDEIDFNTYFAEAVLDRKASGIVYVDDLNFPQVGYIVHSYGMSLLFGNHENINFNQWLKQRWLSSDFKQDEYLQVYPSKWEDTLSSLLSNVIVDCDDTSDELKLAKVVKHVRVNFRFNPVRYESFVKEINWSKYDLREFRFSQFELFKGSVIPRVFWLNEEIFTKYAKAFAIYCEQRPAAVSFASCRDDNVLELGIETNENFRGRGLAKVVCAKLIDYSLEQNLKPVWACRKGNVGSYNLALSLGFEVARELAYYQIKSSVE